MREEIDYRVGDYVAFDESIRNLVTGDSREDIFLVESLLFNRVEVSCIAATSFRGSSDMPKFKSTIYHPTHLRKAVLSDFENPKLTHKRITLEVFLATQGISMKITPPGIPLEGEDIYGDTK